MNAGSDVIFSVCHKEHRKFLEPLLKLQQSRIIQRFSFWLIDWLIESGVNSRPGSKVNFSLENPDHPI